MWAQTVCLADERNLPDFGAKQKLTLSHILVAKSYLKRLFLLFFGRFQRNLTELFHHLFNGQ